VDHRRQHRLPVERDLNNRIVFALGNIFVKTNNNIVIFAHVLMSELETEKDQKVEEMDDDEDDEIEEDDDYDDEDDENVCEYYKCGDYESYVSPAGKRYQKHNATVPDELLIPYIQTMNYTMFEMPDCIIEMDDWCVKIKKYKTHKTSKTKISLTEADEYERAYKEILKLIKRPEVATVICRRPSYIYTSDDLIGNDCCYDSDDMEYAKFTEMGAREVHFYPETNTFELQ